MTDNEHKEHKEQFVLHGTVAVVEGSGDGFQITHVLTDTQDPETVYLTVVSYAKNADFTDARTVALPQRQAHALGSQLLAAQSGQRTGRA